MYNMDDLFFLCDVSDVYFRFEDPPCQASGAFHLNAKHILSTEHLESAYSTSLGQHFVVLQHYSILNYIHFSPRNNDQVNTL